ncbi:hypothetical protein OF83DRAFT_423660 [Amylostereum chailletii]|nr:hypothetical protein OF83DRAFT_423660 [Amylostereum chailletii]
MSFANRKPFEGPKRQLVLAFDLGTTFSGISYALLDPGKVPEIKTVTRYPGQEAGDSKVQTVFYYSADGKVLAVGAEDPSLDDDFVSEDDWQEVAPLKLEWFKLLLRPPAVAPDPSIPTAHLPPNKDIVAVFADFYAYLFARARAFIQETHASGDLLWDSVKEDVRFVLSHPNGWEGAQQSAMRRAAVLGGLVPDALEGYDRVTFVSEGEASFHYCVASGLAADAIETGKNVMIIDAGGGTVDISTYTFAEASPIAIEEIAPAECIFQGSVLVRKRASDYLAKRLKDSRFGTPEYVHAISEEFDKTTKKRFKGAGDSYVKFSNMTADRDPQAGIRNGQIKLSVDEVASFFQPTIDGVIRTIEAQRKAAAPAEISTYLLVGGFAASEFLYAKLRDHLQEQGRKLFRPDSHTNKAVAEGAVSFHVDHYVSSRVAKVSYGTYVVSTYNEEEEEHRRRAKNAYVDLDGRMVVPGGFACTLEQGTHVAETTVFETPLWKITAQGIDTIVSRIVCYRGAGPCPEWADEDPDVFTTLCTVSADVSGVPRTPRRGPLNTEYFTQAFTLVLSFGLTELKAHIAWSDRVRGVLLWRYLSIG